MTSKFVTFKGTKNTHFLQRSRRLSPKIEQTTIKKMLFCENNFAVELHLVKKTLIVVIKPSSCLGQADDKIDCNVYLLLMVCVFAFHIHYISAKLVH